MIIKDIPFQTIDWSTLPSERHDGETGYAYWKTLQYKDIRVRVVEYSPEYKADHWCFKGHILYCLSGDLTTQLQDGRSIEIRQGMSYHVEDDHYPHSSQTKNGAVLFIVD